MALVHFLPMRSRFWIHRPWTGAGAEDLIHKITSGERAYRIRRECLLFSLYFFPPVFVTRLLWVIDFLGGAMTYFTNAQSNKARSCPYGLPPIDLVTEYRQKLGCWDPQTVPSLVETGIEISRLCSTGVLI